MSTKQTPYVDTLGGRLVLLSTAIAVGSLGGVALAGPGDHILTVASAVPLFLIVLCLYGVGVSMASYPLHALALLLILPIVGAPYLALLHEAAEAGLGLGIALLALALYPGVRTFLPSKQQAATAAAD